MNLKTIATIQSCYMEKFGTPRQGMLVPESLGAILFNDDYKDESFIEDLKLFSHIWIIAGFHLSTTNSNSKIRAPKFKGQKLSVFATRSPHRPNSLTLSLVKIEGIMPGEILISGLDLIEGTPVYDIKPYIPDYDICNSARSELKTKIESLKIHFLESASNQLAEIVQNNLVSIPAKILGIIKNRESNVSITHFHKYGIKDLAKSKLMNYLQNLIIHTVSQDPRPIPYLKGYEERIYGFTIYNLNVQFSFEKEAVNIVSIKVIS